MLRQNTKLVSEHDRFKKGIADTAEDLRRRGFIDDWRVRLHDSIVEFVNGYPGPKERKELISSSENENLEIDEYTAGLEAPI